MLDIVLTIAIGAVAVAMAITAWRLVAGPALTDRILALDTLYVNTVAVAVLTGIRYDTFAYFEAGLLVALMGFVSTVALARYAARGKVMD